MFPNKNFPSQKTWINRSSPAVRLVDRTWQKAARSLASDNLWQNFSTSSWPEAGSNNLKFCWNFLSEGVRCSQFKRSGNGKGNYNGIQLWLSFYFYLFVVWGIFLNVWNVSDHLFPVCAQKDLPAQSSFTATKPQLLKTTSIRKAGQVLPLLPKLRIHK